MSSQNQKENEKSRFSERWLAEAAKGFAAASAAGLSSTLNDFMQNFRALRRFAPEQVSAVALSPEVARFLVEEGLPEDAAPWLALERTTHVLRPIAEVWRLAADDPRRAALSQCYALYTDGYGNPLVIDIARHGAVLLLDHESGLRDLCYVNASPIALAECLLLRMQAMPQAEALRAIAAFDEAATAPGTFWHTHLTSDATAPPAS